MNAERRKRIAALEVSNVISELESLRDEEQGALDSMPESQQEGERGEKMQEIIDALEEAISGLQTLEAVEL